MRSDPPPLKTIGIIDLGSNSARIVMFKSRAGYAYHVDTEIREIVRLREGMTEAGLSAAATERAYHTLRLFAHFAESMNADEVVATATSAVREAADGAAFARRIETETGLPLRVLSGEEEAYYGVIGVLNALPLDQGVVLDIGGGSIQLSLVEGGRFARGQALSLGALALTERFVQSDRASRKQIKKMQRFIHEQLDRVEWLAPRAGGLVGMGGTIRNLAKIDAVRAAFPLQRIGGYTLTRHALGRIVEELAEKPVKERQQIRGLNADRADIILAGALVLDAVMDRYEFEALTVSPNGLREGLFFEQFWAGQPYPVPGDVRRFSVLNMARFYGYHEGHAHHVARLAGRLFDECAPLHGYGAEARELLDAAALLHDLGTVINYHDHHKHSESLIVSSGLPGYTPRETAVIALAARYHRKGEPDLGPYRLLAEPGDERLVAWLSALLRLAEYLERGVDGNVRDVQVTLTPDVVAIVLEAREYPFVELWESEKNALELAQRVCERDVVLRAAAPAAAPD